MQRDMQATCSGSTQYLNRQHATAQLMCVCICPEHLSIDAPLASTMLQGRQYWADERRLCKIMLDAQASHMQEAGFDLLNVHNTSEGKSFDYRVGARAWPMVKQCSTQQFANCLLFSTICSTTRRLLQHQQKEHGVLPAGPQPTNLQADQAPI